MYKADSKVYYCCHVSNLQPEGIILPRDKPFFLFPYGSTKCQPVIGTENRLERIVWDLENDGNEVAGLVAFKGYHPFAEISKEGMHLIMFYCFYNPGIFITTFLLSAPPLHITFFSLPTLSFIDIVSYSHGYSFHLSVE